MDSKKAMELHPHLAQYVAEFAAKHPMPDFHERLSREMKSLKKVNVIYPVGDPIFVHIWDDEETGQRKYVNIEPRMEDEERKKYQEARDRILRLAPFEATPRTQEELRQTLRKLIDKSTRTGAVAGFGPAKLMSNFDGRVVMAAPEKQKVAYFLERDIVDSGVLEPIIRDPYIEDISSIGTFNIFVIHKIFDTVETNIKFRDDKELDDYLRGMGERVGRPVSESRPIVDAVLPDGSRINIIYSDDVSQRGSSFTIRKFSDTPTSITQICKWGTMSTSVAA
jgi:flagellar protein FlaI